MTETDTNAETSNLYKVSHDPIRDFAPVTQISSAPYALVVHASLPVKSMAEFVAYAKANPGKINYGSQGKGSMVHLTGELLKANCGIDMVHVPYKGAGAAFTDLLANQIQLGILTLPSALPYTKSDKLRALAVTSEKRAKAVPDLPTMTESDIKNFVVTQWHGVLAPKETPQPIVERLNREIVKCCNRTKRLNVWREKGRKWWEVLRNNSRRMSRPSTRNGESSSSRPAYAQIDPLCTAGMN